MKVFLSQVHTYFNERSKATGERKWVNNERVVTSINKKLAKLETKIDDADKTPANKEGFLKEAIAETKKIIETFEKAGVSHKEIHNLQKHIEVLDKKLNQLELREGLQMVVHKDSKEPVDLTQKRESDNLKGRGVEKEINLYERNLEPPVEQLKTEVPREKPTPMPAAPMPAAPEAKEKPVAKPEHVKPEPAKPEPAAAPPSKKEETAMPDAAKAVPLKRSDTTKAAQQKEIIQKAMISQGLRSLIADVTANAPILEALEELDASSVLEFKTFTNEKMDAVKSKTKEITNFIMEAYEDANINIEPKILQKIHAINSMDIDAIREVLPKSK
jgi:hypothetical protein